MKDVPVQQLIGKLSEELKKNENITPPDWSRFVKTGVSVERPPMQKDWWFTRSAAILRRVNEDGPLGVEKLRTAFGGARKMQHKKKTYHHRKAGGKIIRLMLQQLEKAGYIQKVTKPKIGRAITPKGQKLLSKVTKEI
jgi:small subunit ribosomal protein S19e